MVKRSRGRPRKYKTREQLLAARRSWAKKWRLKNPEKWRAIQKRADHKRKGRRSILSFPPLELGGMKPKALKAVGLD